MFLPGEKRGILDFGFSLGWGVIGRDQKTREEERGEKEDGEREEGCHEA